MVAYSETDVLTLFFKVAETDQVGMETICAEAKTIDNPVYACIYKHVLYVLYIYIPISQWSKMVSIIRLFKTS